MAISRICLLVLLILPALAHGEARVITTADQDNDGLASGRGADGFISPEAPTTNFGQATTLPTRTAAGDCRIYLRFDLSAIKERPIIHAALGLTLVAPSTATRQRWNLFGLTDGDPDENWIEGNGGSDDLPEREITWLDAPAQSQATGKLDPSRIRFLGTLVVDNTDRRLIDGDAAVRLTNQALIRFLNKDTNNLVTFIITPADKDPAIRGTIASRKDPLREPPVLLTDFLADSCSCQRPGYEVLDYPLAPTRPTIRPAAAIRVWVVNQRHPDADDQNDGTESRPLKTIARAAELARPGDTVLVHAGTYRENIYFVRNGTEDRPITYAAAPGEKVILKCSDIWRSPWSADPDHPGIFTATIPAGAREPFRRRRGNPAASVWASAPTLGQFYVNGMPLTQVLNDKDLESTSGSWMVDPAGRLLQVHFPGPSRQPSQGLIEFTSRLRISEPPPSLPAHIRLEGFIFEQCPQEKSP